MTNAIPNYGTVYPELSASGVYNSCQYAFIKHAGYPKQVNSAGPWDRARGSMVSATEIFGTISWYMGRCVRHIRGLLSNINQQDC